MDLLSKQTKGGYQMKYAIGFGLGTLFGGLIGASVALLFAPSSGEELRTNIKTRADAEYVKLQEDWQKGREEMQARMDKMSTELQRLANRSKETSEPNLN
jgi:gas vesicle protein